MKLPAFIAAALIAVTPTASLAHHHQHHRYQENNTISNILGLAIIGAGVYIGVNEYNRDYRDYGYHHRHRRHRHPRVVEEFHDHGRRYRICRDYKRAYYC